MRSQEEERKREMGLGGGGIISDVINGIVDY